MKTLEVFQARGHDDRDGSGRSLHWIFWITKIRSYTLTLRNDCFPPSIVWLWREVGFQFDFDLEVISFKETNDELNQTGLSAAPIPLIETASIPLPIQNFSDIIDDLNVGSIPLEFINGSLNIFNTNSPEDPSADNSFVIMNHSAAVILTPIYYLLFYCHIWIKNVFIDVSRRVNFSECEL